MPDGTHRHIGGALKKCYISSSDEQVLFALEPFQSLHEVLSEHYQQYYNLIGKRDPSDGLRRQQELLANPGIELLGFIDAALKIEGWSKRGAWSPTDRIPPETKLQVRKRNAIAKRKTATTRTTTHTAGAQVPQILAHPSPNPPPSSAAEPPTTPTTSQPSTPKRRTRDAEEDPFQSKPMGSHSKRRRTDPTPSNSAHTIQLIT